VLVAMASLLVSVLLATSSPTFAVIAVAIPRKIGSRMSPLTTSIGVDNESERDLFELTSPFDFFNEQCASACSSQEEQEEENDEGPLISACPKVSEKIIVPIDVLHVRPIGWHDRQRIIKKRAMLEGQSVDTRAWRKV
jgi:hypothetical protein